MTDVVTETFAVGERKTLLGGLFFKIIDSVDPVDIEIVRSGFPSSAKNIPQGFTLGPLPENRRVEKFRITSATAQQIRVLVGDDIADLDRFDALVAIEQANDLAVFLDNVVGAGAEVIAAGNANRKSVTIQNIGLANVRIGGFLSVGPAQGIQLVPGQSVTLTTTAGISAIREGGTNTTVTVLEEIRTPGL